MLVYINPNFRLYKAALNVADPFGRFMFLYSILYSVLREQQEIENYISTYSPSVEMLERVKTLRNGKEIVVKEPVYTWIRNHMGHTHNSTDMKQVLMKINQHIEGLEYLVKEVIF